MMNRTTPASIFVRSADKVHGLSRVCRWLQGVAVGCLVLALTRNTEADTLVGYTFNGTSVGQTNNFTYNSVASTVTASTMTAHAMGTVGVVTGFLGATNNNSYVFDGRGFSAPSSILVNGGTTPEPTNNYVTFTLTPTGGRAVTITNVQVDFGLDANSNNATGTQAQYDLYLSRNGIDFTRIGSTSTNSNVGKTYPGYTINNNVNKAVTGFTNETGTITFRLAFADSNASDVQKRVFFDDVVVSGTVIPTVELQVDDAIAYEPNTNLLAQFSFVRSDTNGSLAVNIVFTQSDLTNGAATFGKDYKTAFSNVVTFASGEKKKSVQIRPVDDNLIEPPESITLNLLASSNYVIIGPTNGVAVLYDDEQPQLGVCFRDTFDTPASATNWTQLFAQSGGTNVETPLVVFGYDYAAAGIPPAPGITTNYGLKLAFTNTAISVPAVVNLFHSFSDCSPDWYALSFDMYLQYNATNSLPLHAMAGINANPTNINWVFQSPFSIHGSGQFMTLVGNDTTNTAIAGAQLWAPGYSASNALASFLPGPTVNQLANNPPYGANGGSPGVFGCALNSTNKAWLHCQLIQLGDQVQFKINGHTALEAVVTNAQFAANGMPPGGSGGSIVTSNGPIVIGANQQVLGQHLPYSFVLFDNVEVIPLNGIQITSMAIGPQNVVVLSNEVVLTFYSLISSDKLDYTILGSTSLANLRQTPQVPPSITANISLPGVDTRGWFRAQLYNAFFTATNARFFQVEGTNRNAKVTAAQDSSYPH